MTEVLFMDSRTLSRPLIQPPYSAYILLALVLKKEYYHDIPRQMNSNGGDIDVYDS